MDQPVKLIELELDLGQDQVKKREARHYIQNNQEVTLADFLRLYPARAPQPPPADYFNRPLKHFDFSYRKLPDGIPLEPGEPQESQPIGELRRRLDELYEKDLARSAELKAFPEKIGDRDAVQVAYRHELQHIVDFLKHGLSVLIVCDKILTEHLYEDICKRAGKTPVLDDAVPQPRAQGRTRDVFDRAMQGGGGIESNLRPLIRSLRPDQVLVLRSLDLLDNPALIEVLYEGVSGNNTPQLLGFLDPSLEVKKVLSDRFAVHVGLTGLPRYIRPDPKKPPVHTVTRLITAAERQCFQALDPEGLYKNVSGLNAAQFRNAMRYVGATVAPGSDSRHIYDVIRQFKISSSDEIEIPDTTFDAIGGYERVKQELRRIIALVSGQVQGISEEEREKLIPRGFIFHGPPGTGKTLFAKAIANEMNATIQMVSGPEIMDKYVGQSESNLRRIFATARRNAPSVIFFDEFDSIASQRSTYSDGGTRANNAVVAQLLTELDGFRQGQAVLVIGTSNRLDIIDEALLRPSRLRPIEIGLPDYTARQQVARIHARSFGIDTLLTDLCQMAIKQQPADSEEASIPPNFLTALLTSHRPYQARYEAENQLGGFKRDLQAFFKLVQIAQYEDGTTPETAPPQLQRLKKRLLEIAPKYGLDLIQPDSLGSDDEVPWLSPMQADLRELYQMIQQQHSHDSTFSAKTFLDEVLNLIAEYTEDFNNDEIRAIFQEASLEHHLDGQLITPRYLGMKIGLIKKRRDEREVTHLSTERGQH